MPPRPPPRAKFMVYARCCRGFNGSRYFAKVHVVVSANGLIFCKNLTLPVGIERRSRGTALPPR